jgi:hypothetical protein
MSCNQSPGQTTLPHGKNGVVRLQIGPDPQIPGNQVLSALQDAAGEAVPSAQKAELSGDGLTVGLEQQFPAPRPQLALQNNGITDFFQSNHSCFVQIIKRPSLLPKGQLRKKRRNLDIIVTIVKIRQRKRIKKEDGKNPSSKGKSCTEASGSRSDFRAVQWGKEAAGP